MKTKVTQIGISALLAIGLTCGAPLVSISPAYASSLPSIEEVQETDSTGLRTSATTLDISLGAGISGKLDVGTGNLTSTMNLAGFTLSHNSLAPQLSGTGTRHNWRVSGLGAGNLFTEGNNTVLIGADGEKITFVPSGPNTYEDIAGKRYSLTRTEAGFTLAVWDSNTTIHYTAAGYPQKAVDRNGNETILSFDNGLPKHTLGWQGPDTAKNSWLIAGTASDIFGMGTDESSLKVSWKLDSADGKYTQLTNPRGLKTGIEYDSAGRISKVSTAGGAYTKIFYDAQNRVTKIATTGTHSNPKVEAVTRFDYTDGSKTLVAGANTNQAHSVPQVPHTAYYLNAGNRVVKVVDARGLEQSASYTENLNIGSYTSGVGATAGTQTFSYGANNSNSMTEARGANGESYTYDYDSQTASSMYSPVSSTDPRGNTTIYSYAKSGALASSTNALSSVAEVGYNDNGTPAFAVAPGNTGNPTRYEYNSYGLLSRVVPAQGGTIAPESYSYDDLGRLSSKTTGRGGVIRYTYEGNTSLVTKVSATSSGENTADAAQENSYDSLGRVVSTQSFAKGKVVQRTTYSYSARGEVVEKSIWQAAVGGEKEATTRISYQYDLEGKLVGKVVDGQRTAYNYNPNGALDGVDYWEAGAKKSIWFEYDERGRRTKTIYGASAQGAGDWSVLRLTEYDRSGNIALERVERANSVRPTRSNPRGIQVLSSKKYCYVPGVDPNACPADTHQAVDKIQSMYTENAGLNQGYVTWYSYDQAGRLLEVNTPGTRDGKYSYAYDIRGNKVETVQLIEGQEPRIEQDTYNAQNQVTSDSWIYDADGNQISSEKAEFVYNAANQNISSSLKDGSNSTSNTFAGMTQKELIAQSSSGEGTYVYTHGLNDRYGNPLIEKIRHEGRTAYVEHDPVTGNPLFLRDTDRVSTHMYISDPIDSDIRLVEDDGSSSDYKEFDPYGARHEVYAPSDRDKFDPFRYRFGLVDRGGTGRFLFGVRWYDPHQGVWTQQDSLDAPLDPVNANRYGYAGGDPVNNWDPAGLAAWQFSFGFCAAVCGSFNITSSDDGEEVSMGAELGAGGELSADIFIGRTSGDPTRGYDTFYNLTCGGALGLGIRSGAHSGAQSGNSTSDGALFGLGLGCSTTFSWDWEVK